ncbi:hypothetical protein EST38_g1236 [Candolleomyces aberdarensis]|uniref:Uncharacterized protein n=1 Tax=Candolleomyces aberdarensis TaxID=2316362 RepID=A0A4Q2DWC5_9AGAR|nr:hypothetical protein EST38_g1236 [Candolleomyces aberdarensis]
MTKVIDAGKQPSSSCLNLGRNTDINEEDSDVEEIERPPKLDIAQFAFSTGISQKASTSKLKTQPTIGDVTVLRGEPPKKARSVKAPVLSLSSEFKDKDYEKVLRCIACDASWTARKGVAQKVQHMRSCCKKAAYTQETIDTLLRKAINEALPPDNPQPQEESTTLFNDYNPPATKKKKTRSEQPKNTVKNVADTRAEILNRAQQYLQDPQSPQSQGRDSIEPPPTQQFGRSKLGAARRTMTLLNQEQDVSPLKGKSPAARFSP